MTRIENLEPNSTYHVFVVAINENGESLPSSMLLFNATDVGESISAVKSFSIQLNLQVQLIENVSTEFCLELKPGTFEKF